MLENNKMVKVTNRTKGSVVYKVPDLRIRRSFAPGEVKEVTMEELRKLSYTTGGKAIIVDCLLIEDKQVVMELVGEMEPEYYYSPAKVKEVLLEGSLDAFLDCLDFAPEGVIDLIKDLAVKHEVNDVEKRKAILKKTGFDVTKAIEINHESGVEEETKTRRVAVEGEKPASAQPARRVVILNQ